MKIRNLLMLGIGLFVIVAFCFYQLFPRINPVVEQRVKRSLTYFTKKPTLKATEVCLTQESIRYRYFSPQGIFAGDIGIANNFQTSNKARIGSAIIFTIPNVRRSLFGHADEVVNLSFDRNGRLLNVESGEQVHSSIGF